MNMRKSKRSNFVNSEVFLFDNKKLQIHIVIYFVCDIIQTI